MGIKPIHRVFYRGRRLSIGALVADPELNPLRLSYNCVHKRLDSGWSVFRAMNKPMKHYKARKNGKVVESTVMKGVHPEIKHEMLYGNSNSFLRACEKFKKGDV